jgi:hypothetical protein
MISCCTFPHLLHWHCLARLAVGDFHAAHMQDVSALHCTGPVLLQLLLFFIEQALDLGRKRSTVLSAWRSTRQQANQPRAITP